MPGVLVELLEALLQALVHRVVVEGARHVADVSSSRSSTFSSGLRRRELLDRLASHRPVVVVRDVAARHRDQVEALGQCPLVREVVDGRQQLALGQVARPAEDDQRRGMDGQPLEPFRERVRPARSCALDRGLSTACPRTGCGARRAPGRCSRPAPRLVKRANSAAVITGVGHVVVDGVLDRPASLAGVVHEAADAARSLPSCSKASAASSHSHERTTDPCIQSFAIFSLSSSKSDLVKSSKPSA